MNRQERLQERLREQSSPCVLCPHNCRAKRACDEYGRCGVGSGARVASWGPHFGEEPELVGRGGSGTIFFSGCNLRCVFCQNYDISHRAVGDDVSTSSLVKTMLSLQGLGCANVNLVTPTHFSHEVAASVARARKDRLQIPVVYNCGGYESVATLKLLDEYVDIWMPDVKTLDERFAEKHLNAADYPTRVREALERMAAMQAENVMDGQLLKRGVLVRHLVMPDMVTDSKRILDMVAQVAPNALVNVMGQYRPVGPAYKVEPLSRRTSGEETRLARNYASDIGLALTS